MGDVGRAVIGHGARCCALGFGFDVDTRGGLHARTALLIAGRRVGCGMFVVGAKERTSSTREGDLQIRRQQSLNV
jgi:hypothetical protein